MGGQTEGVGEGEEGSFSFATKFISVGTIARSHEGSPSNGFIGAFPAMRKTESMAQFVTDSTDENRVVFAKGNAAVFAVLYHGLLERDVFWVEFGGVELPGGASLEVAAGVVGGIVFKDEIFLIPSGEVAKEDDGFLVGINSCFF